MLDHALSVVEVAVKHLHSPYETLPPGPVPSRFRDRNLSDQGQALGPSDQGRGFTQGDILLKQPFSE